MPACQKSAWEKVYTATSEWFSRSQYNGTIRFVVAADRPDVEMDCDMNPQRIVVLVGHPLLEIGDVAVPMMNGDWEFFRKVSNGGDK